MENAYQLSVNLLSMAPKILWKGCQEMNEDDVKLVMVLLRETILSFIAMVYEEKSFSFEL